MDVLRKMKKGGRVVKCLFFLCLGFMVSAQSSAEVNDIVCGSLENHYGPYDYRSDKDKLGIVETFHLTSNVINLSSAQSASTVGGDLDYTLRAFPNHHIALMAMTRLGEKEKLAKPRGAKFSVECYLQRAFRFRNDDTTVKMLYAAYLAKSGKKTEALAMLDEMVNAEEETANVYYNIGLIYFELKDYEKSLSYARRAYDLGFPLPGLRDKLKRAGKWKD